MKVVFRSGLLIELKQGVLISSLFFVVALLLTYPSLALSGGEVLKDSPINNYDQKIENLLDGYPLEYHDFLRAVLIRWKEEKNPLFMNDDFEVIKKDLDQFYESEKGAVEKFNSEDVDAENDQAGNRNFTAPPKIPKGAAYNEFGFRVGKDTNTRHFGTRDFDRGYVFLVRIERPKGFNLKHKHFRQNIGQYAEQSQIAHIKADRNRIYDLFSKELPAGTLFRVQDVYQRHEGYLFVHLELAADDISPEQFLSLPIIDRVYRFFSIQPHTRIASYDMAGGNMVRVKELKESWDKESTYSLLKDKLSDPYYSFAKVTVELSPKGNDTERSSEDRLQSILESNKEYNLHPYAQYSLSLPVEVLDEEPNPLLREFGSITLEQLEMFYQSDEIINITPKL